MREYVWLECTACGDRNYRVQKETRERTGSNSRSIVGASGSIHRTRNRGKSSGRTDSTQLDRAVLATGKVVYWTE